MLDICLRCSDRECESTKIDTFDFCRHGVAFYNTGSSIKKKEESITLRHISHNLRHELNKVLQTIISEASKIDGSVSAKRIDPENPASKIVGATIIIDQFIEMISGVNEFHPSSQYSKNLDKKVLLRPILEKYLTVYSLILNTRRSKDISFDLRVSSKTHLTFSSNIAEYIISILIDNIWKYSVDNSVATIEESFSDEGDLTLSFKNLSLPIDSPSSIFEKGFQTKKESEGFGYGLYWANILVEHYNTLSKRSSEILSIEHEQKVINESLAEQVFVIRNLRA